MARRQVVSIVGCGRVGGAIGLALQRGGYTVSAAWSRSRTGRQRAHRILDVPVLADPAEVARAGDVVLLSVPDDAIAEMAARVAPGVRAGRYVVHTSGGTQLDSLAAARDAGARVASTHPLQTIPDATNGAEALKGAAVAVTCSPEDRLDLFRLARAWGGRPFLMPDDAKTIYHAAAVFASNFVVGTVWAAVSLLRQAGLRDAQTLLTPLLKATVDNIAARGAEKSMTGPVARGDVGTVRRHIEALSKADPVILDAYRALAGLSAHMLGSDDAFAEALRP
jgi:predicted short-subunit dehydrogenase-like oxidoreductase (DUF2520 family)